MVSLATPVDRTLYFDFLPLRVPSLRGLGVRLQLYTVPGQVYYNATRKLVLTGADGVVLVADSQRARTDANIESLINLRENLREHGRLLSEVPHVIQYNKRDLPEILSIEELEQKLNGHGVPAFGTVAMRGDGIYEALEAITRAVLEDFERRMPEARGAGEPALELPEGGLVEALRQAEPVLAAPQPISVGPPAVRSPEPEPALPAAHAPEPLAALSAIPLPDVPPLSSAEKLPSFHPAPEQPRDEEILDYPSAFDLPVLSFSVLWPESERASVRELEHALARRDPVRSLELCDSLVTRALAGAAAVLGGGADAPRDPALVALLLGIDGERYLSFRAAVRSARMGRTVAHSEALAAYAFLLEVRTARSRAGA
jgi:signal recognition particle receptor subunit beta